jgi:integrase
VPTTNKLSDNKIKTLRAGDKPIKVFDGGGLYLFVATTGSKLWRMTYRLAGKAQTVTFGPYPLVTLAEARARRDDVRRGLLVGELPQKDKPAPLAKSVLTLAKASDLYWETRKDVSANYLMNATNAIKRHIEPKLGTRDVSTITRGDVLDALNVMDAAGLYVYVRKTRMWLSQVFEWCVEQEHCENNPCLLIRPERAFGRAKVEHHASLPLGEVSAFMARLGFEAEIQSALACRLMALTWTRTGELREMKWTEIEGDVWSIPAKRMKKSRDHAVPLSTQALAIIAKLRARNRGSEYVFPNDRRLDRPMSENAILYLMDRMGFGGRMTGHGWRTVGSTWANENGYSADAIEKQLAHEPDDKVRAAYNRAEFMPERRAMLQDFANWLMPD